MELCLTASQIIEALLPDQKPSPEIQYRPSIYNLENTSDNRTYIYNVLTRRLARLTAQEAKLLRQNEIAGNVPEAAPLIAKRFLVPVQTNEVDHYCQIYKTQETFLSAMDSGYTFYEVLPTTGCNARCFYCYEQGVKVKNMTEETADAIVDFILRTRNPNKELEMSWFGGEPLLRPGIIDRICTALNKAGVPFFSTMITNGSLFTPELVEKAKNNWHMRRVQITLDGTAQEHNRRKAYVSLPNAYEVTLDTISRLVKADIPVAVRLNMDLDNAEDIAKVYEYLRTHYKPEDRIVVNTSMITESWFNWSIERSQQEKTQLREQWLALQKQMYDDGFYRPKKLSASLPRWHCVANGQYGVAILPDGVFSICQTGCEDWYYGDVWQGITKPELLKTWRENTNIREKCKQCPYLPECTGFAMCPVQRNDCRQEKADTLALRLDRTIKALEQK